MNDTIDHIIARVLSGEASSHDILQLSKWLNEDEKNRIEFSYLKNYWDAEIRFDRFATPEFTLEKVQSKIKEHKEIRKRKLLWQRWVPFAASFLLFITFGTLYLFQPGEKRSGIEKFTYLTGVNKSEFSFEDGTKVILNKNSRLTYTSQYGKENRFVKLEGEAFFEVSQDSVRPFIVSVAQDQFRVKVVGTHFNVNAYPGQDEVHTTLVEGAVIVQFADPLKNTTEKSLNVVNKNAVYSLSFNKISVTEERLLPQEKAIYNLIAKRIHIDKVKGNEDLAWKDGLIRYNAIAFSRLMKDLEKRFNVSIYIENKILESSSVTVSGSFPEEQTLEDMLEVISRSLPIKWEKTNDKTFIIL